MTTAKRIFSLGLAIALFANLSAPALAFADPCTDLKEDAKELKVQEAEMNKVNAAVAKSLAAFKIADSDKKDSQMIGIPLSVISAAVGTIALFRGALENPTGSAFSSKYNPVIAGAAIVTVGTVVMMYISYQEAKLIEDLLKKAQANQKEIKTNYRNQREFLMNQWMNNSCPGNPFKVTKK